MNLFPYPVAALLLFLTISLASAGSATWGNNPSSGDWNAAANWTPQTVPDGPGDVATFGQSAVTNVSINATIVEVSNIVFTHLADPFIISLASNNNNGLLDVTGSGIINHSRTTQKIVCGENTGVFFTNGTAGEHMSFIGAGASFAFSGVASAESATFDVSSSGIYQGHLIFDDSSTVANATINASNSAGVSLYSSSSSDNAIFAISSGAFLAFAAATADHATATCIGGQGIYGSSILFQGLASAGEGYFTAIGGTTSGEAGSDIDFYDFSTAADATFVINGGAGPSLAGALLLFENSSTAANATITVNGGAGGAEGGAVIFHRTSTGGIARIELLGNGELDISRSHLTGVTIGSLSGDGLVFLGSKTLTIGSNSQSATFSGVIRQSGSLAKIGTGTLTITGSNAYTGTTTVTGGVLNASNRMGSATGPGAVKINAGTLGGRGIIAGPTTIGTGSGAGAFLAPAVASNKQTALTFQGALTLNADAIYTCTFKARKNKSRADLVIANGVTINGATLDLVGQTEGRLKRGLTLTVISNTSANPISGTFANLPDGAIVTIDGNNLQASYEGGDGNDLTLTVVP